MEEIESQGMLKSEETEEDYSAITLRLIDLSDVDDYMVWAGDDKVTRFCSWEAYTSKEDLIKFITQVVIPHPWFRAICLNGRPIGSISVCPYDGINKCRGELGYVLASKYWGKGIVTKAVKMASSMIFADWPHLRRLEALVDVENVGSQKVLEKAGFTREGILREYCLLKGHPRDMVMFSLLSSDLLRV